MKNSFFLYFLVLSPLIFSQNSFHSSKDNFLNNPIFDSEHLIFTPKRNLAIIDHGFSKTYRNSWFIPPADSLILDETKEFSSLELLSQLEKLDFKTPFHLVHNPTLERFIRHFLNSRSEELSNIMDRSEYYFPLFEEYLDKYDLPLEIKYLAVIESALKANAVSSSGAKGLWQFILSTGKEYDLDVNSYVDERFDPVKSTEAACKYLKKLHERFNNWDLALAAYNSGPGNVSKAIKRAGGKRNYWEIRKYLPQETRGYIPAFYATFYIFEYADSHGLKPIKSELSYIEVDTVHLKNPLSFASIQKNININYELLKTLNPQYKKDFIPFSKNNKYVLTLPENLALKFVENEGSIYQLTNESRLKNYSSGSIQINKQNSYKVSEGDNLKRIAKKHHITLEQLKKWNGLQTDYLIVDQRLVITNEIVKNSTQTINKTTKTIHPFTPKLSPKFPLESGTTNFSNGTNTYETYVVLEGDTLFKISRKFAKVAIEQIRIWNNLSDVTYLKPGTKLKIYKSQI